jgi:hypothetical protein
MHSRKENNKMLTNHHALIGNKARKNKLIIICLQLV